MTRHPSKEKEKRKEQEQNDDNGESDEDGTEDVNDRCLIMDFNSSHHSDQRVLCAPLGEEMGRIEKYEKKKKIIKSLTARETQSRGKRKEKSSGVQGISIPLCVG
jgi:hypothetical protein